MLVTGNHYYEVAKREDHFGYKRKKNNLIFGNMNFIPSLLMNGRNYIKQKFNNYFDSFTQGYGRAMQLVQQ